MINPEPDMKFLYFKGKAFKAEQPELPQAFFNHVHRARRETSGQGPLLMEAREYDHLREASTTDTCRCQEHPHVRL